MSGCLWIYHQHRVLCRSLQYRNTQLAYTVFKGAVLMTTREMAMVHAREQAIALCPGLLKTTLLMALLDTEEKRHKRLACASTNGKVWGGD
ncbi:hypothetical protein PM082_005089 [Marasmius tenuissimus]|nr:hypothetical protein PM082_005089 [Marasmius tenuissimus]